MVCIVIIFFQLTFLIYTHLSSRMIRLREMYIQSPLFSIISVKYFIFKIVERGASSNFLCLFHPNSLRPDPIPSAILFHLSSFRASFLGFILVQYVARAARFRYYIMKLHRVHQHHSRILNPDLQQTDSPATRGDSLSMHNFVRVCHENSWIYYTLIIYSSGSDISRNAKYFVTCNLRLQMQPRACLSAADFFNKAGIADCRPVSTQ